MKRNVFYTVLLNLGLIGNALAQTPIYVDSAATRSNTGASWTNAYTDLNKAIVQANTGSGTFDIYVATGTYKPDYTSLNNNPNPSTVTDPGDLPDPPDDDVSLGIDITGSALTGDWSEFTGTPPSTTSTLTNRDEAFAIKRSGIRMYGGYSHGGATRNITLYPTILDGNADAQGQVYHVLCIASPSTSIYTTDSVVVDGFTVRNGLANNGTHSADVGDYDVPADQGAGIYIVLPTDNFQTPSIVIRNCTITKTWAGIGGGAEIQGGGPLFSGCTFVLDSADLSAGAVSTVSSSATFNGCSFNNNNSQYMAGGVDAAGDAGTVLNFVNCTFNTNHADTLGGALYNSLESGATCTITGCSFNNNNCDIWGGAIANTGGYSVTISNSTFTGNKSKDYIGGAVYSVLVGNGVNISGCTFTGNTSYFSSGAIFSDSTTTNISNCSFSYDSSATGIGGAIYEQGHAGWSVSNCAFSNCNALTGGAVGSLAHCTGSVTNCTFTSNYASERDNMPGGGGALYIGESSETVAGCQFINNTSTLGSGGGIYNDNNGTTNIQTCVFAGNSSTGTGGYGGGMVNFGTATIKNSVFSDNGSNGGFGAGIFSNTGSTTNISLTTVDGSVTSDNSYNAPQGLYLTGSGTIKSSIIWDVYQTEGTVTISNSDVNYYNGTTYAAPAGTGNIYSNPLFSDESNPIGPDKVWGTTDDGYRLGSGSPCIGKGLLADTSGGITTDITGGPRTVSSKVDMGAYETYTVTAANVLTFDGSKSYISLPYISSLSNFTYEAWINTSSSSTQTLIEWGGGNRVLFQIDGGYLTYSEATSNSSFVVATSQSVNDGKWHHVVLVRNNGVIETYVDGTAFANPTSGSTFPATSTLNLGSTDGTSQFFNGQMDEVRIWSRALCGLELNQYSGCQLGSGQTGLAAYYKFNEGNSASANPSDTVLTDASSNSRNGKLINFSLTGTDNWMAASSGVSASACGSYTAPTVTASNSGPITAGATLTLTASAGSPGFTGYEWTGPNGFSSNTQNPAISNAATTATGTYDVTATVDFCSATASTNATVNAIVLAPATVLAFNGAQSVLLPAFNLPGQYTLQAMVNTTSNSYSLPILDWQGNGSELVFGLSQGMPYIYQTNGATTQGAPVNGSEPVNNGSWHNIAIVNTNQPSNNIIVYVDGVVQGTYSLTLTMPTATQTNMGSSSAGYYTGQLDEVRIWNRALCATEINANMAYEVKPSSSGLFAYYQFNEGTNGGNNSAFSFVVDSTNNGHTGAMTGFSLTGGSTANFVKGTGAGSIVTGVLNPVQFLPPNLNAVMGGSITIANGDVTPSTSDSTNFGFVNNAVTSSRTFTISNNGTGVLNISGISVSGPNASYFSISGAPASVAVNSTASFKVVFTPSNTTNTENATIIINSSDCFNTPYTFDVSATGLVSAPGAALNFNGTNNYISIPNISLTAFTYEAMIKTNSGATMSVISGGNANLGISNGGHLTYTEGSSSVPSTVTVNDNNWHQVVVSRNSTATNNINLFVDGVNVGTGTITYSSNYTASYVGADNGSSQYFSGSMDEVRIWNKVLCLDQIIGSNNCEVSTSSSGLVAYYKFNQGNAGASNTSITTATDATSNNNTGTLHNFTLSGSTSNFVTPGGVTTGNTCSSSYATSTFAITDSLGVSIANNENAPSTNNQTNFGDVSINGSPVIYTYVITNSGTANLMLSGTPVVQVTGTGFNRIQDAGSSTIAPNGSTTFRISYAPTATGFDTGTVTIYSSDCTNPVYTFMIIGTGFGGAVTGAALNFNGTSSYCVSNTSNNLPMGSSARTMEAWMKTSGNTNSGDIVNYGTCLNNERSAMLITGAGKLYFSGENDDFSGNKVINDGKWHHVAITFSGGTNGTMILYVDSNVDAQTTINMSTQGTQIMIGNRTAPCGSEFFSGDIDEVRIWNRALCKTEILHNMNGELTGSENGLVAYYRFDQGHASGINPVDTTLIDASPSGNNLKLTNFTLSGSTANFITPGGVTTGNYIATYQPSQISVNANGPAITNNNNSPSVTDSTDFGGVQVNLGALTRTFYVANLGAGPVNITGTPYVTVTGTGFSLQTNLSSATINGNSSASFVVAFAPADTNESTGTITINSTDCTNPVYTFKIQGHGIILDTASAINFNGTNNYIIIPKSVTRDFTIEYWMNTTAVAPSGGGWYNGPGIVDAEVAGVVHDFGTAQNGTKLAFGIGDPDITIFSTSNVNTGNWVHVAATWVQSTGSMSLYINGILEATGTSDTTPRVSPPRILIGATQTLAYYYNGSVGEVRIWDRVLCPYEIQHSMYCQLSGPQTGLMSYYQFNEGWADGNNTAYTTLIDSSGNGNTGTLENMTLTGTTSNWIGGSIITQGNYCSPYNPAVITVQGNSTLIANNDSTPSGTNFTDLGYSTDSGSVSRIFSIINTGGDSLYLSGSPRVTVSGGAFSLVSDASTPIAPGLSANFTIKFAPDSIGVFTGTVTIYAGSCTTPVYTFDIQGSSMPAAALSFNGVNNYCETTSPSNLPMGSSARTLEAWIKTTGNNGNAGDIINYGVCDNMERCAILINPSGVLYFSGEDDDFQGNTFVADGNWHHVAMTYSGGSGGTMKLYVDGKLDAQTDITLNTSGNVLLIGQRSSPCNGEFFGGLIDEARIWNRALCATEIYHDMNGELALPQNGLVAYYRFDEGGYNTANSAVTTLYDSSGNGNNLTLYNFTLSGTTSNWVAPSIVTTGQFVSPYNPAIINISGNNVSVTNGENSPSVSNNTNFGNIVSIGGAQTNMFTISNFGGDTLFLSGSPVVNLSGAGFTLAQDVPPFILPGVIDTFAITFTPTSNGASTGSITINSGDCSNGVYTFAIQGTGINPIPASALNFNGTNNYVEDATATNLPQGNAPRTIECWINTTLSGTAQSVVNYGTSATGERFALSVSAIGRIYFEDQNAAIMGNAIINDGNWHHIAASYTGGANGQLNLYVDGVLDISAAKNLNTTGNDLRIGQAIAPGGEYFAGSVDELRIWNFAKRQDEIVRNMSCEVPGNSSGLVACYHFNEGLELFNNSAVTTLVDSSASVNTGVLNNFALTGGASNWVNPGAITSGTACTPCPAATATVTLTACQQYTSPSGKYTWTTSGTYHDTVPAPSGCDSTLTYSLTIINVVTNQAVTASANPVCANSPVTISVANSESNATYTLVDPSDNIISGPVTGTGSTIKFNLAGLSATTQLTVMANKQNQCQIPLVNTITINVNPLPDSYAFVDSVTMFANATGMNYSWRNCNNSFAVMPNGTTQQYNPTISGTYVVIITNPTTGCVDTSACLPINLVKSPASCLSFDGAISNITIPKTTTSDFTIEYWMNTTTPGTQVGPEWYHGSGLVDAEMSGVLNDFGTSLLGTNVAFGIGNPDVTIVSTSDVTTGQWVHVAATWQQSTGQMNLYINGALEATGTSGTNPRTAPPHITIGSLNTQIYFYAGELDEVRIWNEVRTQTQIQDRMNCEIHGPVTGLTSNYHFNEGDSAWKNTGVNILVDSSGNNNNGTLNNFLLQGTSANWMSPGAVKTGFQCISCNSSVTTTLNVTHCGSYISPSGKYTWTISGTYNDTLTNICGDDSLLTLNLTITVPISSTVTQTNVSCNGDSNGIATVIPSGGTGTYQYRWLPEGGTSATANDLPLGQYTCLITDNSGCSYSQSVTITQPTAITSSVASQTNVTCNGGDNGIVTVTASGGTGTLQYNWSPKGGTAATASDLTAGSYICLITDANSCKKSQAVTITQPLAITGTITTQTNVSCNGESNGSVTISASGGTGTLRYSWSPAGGTNSTAAGLTAGAYSCLVTDMYNCTGSVPVNITQPAPLMVNGNRPPQLLCNNDSTGQATVEVTGGSMPYHYNWSPIGDTSATVNNLPAGTFTCVVTDANNCTGSDVVSITQPSAITSSVASQTNVKCGGQNGTAAVTASGGTGTLSYNWSPAPGTLDPITGTSNYITGLAAGTFDCLITDANECKHVQPVTITQPYEILVLVSTQTNVSCNGGNNGAATVTVSGAIGGVTYFWTPVADTTASISNLQAGYYTCQTTDSNLCIGTHLVDITQPPAISFNVSQTNVSCNGYGNGTATINASGGTGTLNYNWSPVGGNAATASHLSPGPYTCLITDANSCKDTANLTITQPVLLIIALDSSKNNSCYGDSSGSLYTFISGGTTPYSVLWNNGDTVSIITHLFNGSYSMVVVDSNGCNATLPPYTITSPSALQVTLDSVTAERCTGTPTGAIAISVSGGVTSYRYNWNSGAETEDIQNLASGPYSVTVTDFNSCSISLSATVPVIYTSPVVNLGPDVTQCGGSVILNAGHPNLTTQWNNNTTGSTLTVSATGSYSAAVTDTNGCVGRDTVAVTIHTLPTPSFSLSKDTVCEDDAPITLTGTPAGGVFSGTGVSGNSFNPETAGTGSHQIQYEYTDTSNCTGSVTESIYEDVCTGIENIPGNSISLDAYPNPSSGDLIVSATGTMPVRIFNELGQLVHEFTLTTTNHFQFEVTNLTQGVYFVTGWTGNSSITKQIVVIH